MKVLLLIAICLLWEAVFSEDDPLAKCLQDKDYDELLSIVHHGLTKTKNPKHIVIVGAGISGLTAAKVLEDAGHKITIVEASERIGGRILTFRNKNGWYAELGAMRIPNFHKIVLAYIAKFDLILSEFVEYNLNTWYAVNNKLLRTYAGDENPDLMGYEVMEHEKKKSAEQLFQESLSKIVEDLKAFNYSCERMFEKYDSYTVKEYFLREANLSREAVRMMGDLLNIECFMYLSLTEMLYFQSDISDNVKYHEIVGGLDNLPRAFYQRLHSTIYLNSPVFEISQTKDDVSVLFNKQQKLLNIRADFVLLTTTAKAAQVIHFHPPLSATKYEALRAIHYSGSTKVYLSFRERFWEEQGIYGGKSVTDHPSRFIYYPSHNFFNTTGSIILASYTWSDDSSVFLGLSDEDCMKMVLNDLAMIHGQHILKLWDGSGVVKKWGKDPYSLGAFAAFTPYQMTDYLEDLSKNEGRIYFAGEHTAYPHAWIEGAMKSALRNAINIHKA
ncbi:L-amino-acid oxidase [Bombina bombina]|uniref:L-amino-acid oxidase n=1 Tax=Bombina bombina TaxID=8345 RepID=UPI00235AF912|nr:L-amino-acid oxidase [Bombina bombina]